MVGCFVLSVCFAVDCFAGEKEEFPIHLFCDVFHLFSVTDLEHIPYIRHYCRTIFVRSLNRFFCRDGVGFI